MLIKPRYPDPSHSKMKAAFASASYKTMHQSKFDDLSPIFIRELEKTKPLKTKEEAKLAKLIRTGSKKAENELVIANLRFVVHVARNYQHQGLPLEDLVNAGIMGLIKAAKKFDEKKNFKFISYAVWWIRQAILQSISEQSRVVKIPLNKASDIYTVLKTKAKLEQVYQRSPTEEELAEETGLTLEKVENALALSKTAASLSQPSDEDKKTPLGEMLIDESVEIAEVAYAKDMRQKIEQIILTLDDRKQEIIRLYYGFHNNHPSTLDEIGIRMGLTRERVRQLKEKAIKDLKATAVGSGLIEI